MFSSIKTVNSEDQTKQEPKVKKAFFRTRSAKLESENELKSDSRDAVDDATDAKEKRAGFFKINKNQKAAVYRQFSDDPKAVLEVVSEDSIPQVSNENEVVVKVQASTVSYNDCLFRRGMSFSITDPVCCPATPGMDVIGLIVEVGSSVTEWKVGDRVAALMQSGGNARYAVIPSHLLVGVPRSLDTSEAVCMVSIYMTAYQSLKLVIGKERTLKGKTVLVVGALGPVGQALIQMARRARADVVYATAPTNMHRYVASVLGAKPLPMEPDQWLAAVKGKMDVVMDNVCQDGFESSRAALSSDGKLVCVGMSAVLNSESMGVFGAPLSARWAQTKASYFMSRTQVYDVLSSLSSEPKKFKTDLEHVFQLLRQRDIKPHIAKRVCLSEVAEAHVYLELGKSRGAIVCLPWKRRIPGTGVKAGEYGIEEAEMEDDRE